MSSLTNQQLFLLYLSAMVWQKREAAKRSNLPFNEETITETILLDLKTSYPGSVQVIAFNKNQEANTGADWFWAFVNCDGSLSFNMLVQAKRLEDKEKNYPKIKRYIGKRNPPVRQIDQLINTAQHHNVPAAYIFYNHVSDTSRVPKKCGSLSQSDPNQIVGFGISVADALSVRGFLPDETFKSHKAHSIPLHCLLCSKGRGVRSNGGTPEMIARAYNNMSNERVGETVEGDLLGLQEGMHPLVSIALDLAATLNDGGEAFDIDVSRNLAGVIVLKDSKARKE